MGNQTKFIFTEEDIRQKYHISYQLIEGLYDRRTGDIMEWVFYLPGSEEHTHITFMITSTNDVVRDRLITRIVYLQEVEEA